MTPNSLISYVSLTISQPKQMARYLLSLKLSRETLWLAFALVIVVNTLVFSVSVIGSPLSGMMGPVLGNPVAFGVMLAVSVALIIVAVTWSGRAMGGKARLEDISVLVIWLQALRVLVQVTVSVLTLFSAVLAGLIVTAASVLGVWIFVNFIDEAHGLGSLPKALVALVVAVIGMTLALSMVFSLLGFSAAGLPGYV